MDSNHYPLRYIGDKIHFPSALPIWARDLDSYIHDQFITEILVSIVIFLFLLFIIVYMSLYWFIVLKVCICASFIIS